jgi:drug/metabolite transporter (DMT)-like permease
MGVLFGLLTALTWGGSDFIARFAARRIGSLRTTLYMQMIGFALLTIFLPWVGGWGHLLDHSGWQPWAWGVLAGLVNGISTLALYRSFEVGKMSVVAPISSGYPALTVVLAWFSGERLTNFRVAGVISIILGVILVAKGESEPTSAGGAPQRATENSQPLPDAQKTPASEVPVTQSDTSTGIWPAFLSAIGFGVLFWLLGRRVVPAVGFAAAVWMIRLSCTILAAAVLLTLKQTLALPLRNPVSVWLLGMGIFDTSAFLLNNRGLELEQTSVISVLASLYGAVTVSLAAIFLREHPTRWQWVGIVAIFAGIALISR